jgi:hypothetical protein
MKIYEYPRRGVPLVFSYTTHNDPNERVLQFEYRVPVFGPQTDPGNSK